MQKTDQEISRLTRRSFLTGGIASAAGFGTWMWIRHSFQEGGIPKPLRRAEQADDVFSRALFSQSRLARTFDAADIGEARANGDIGLADDIDPDWKLEIEGANAVSIDQIKALPKFEEITQFKCIEGWSEIVHWAGIRMADFMEAYLPALIDGGEPKFVYMETPDGDYYTGYDLNVCRHPQTLLVTEMMGAPLTQYHGAPLRLHMPTKYGYKQIKRIGLISYTNRKPDDYWTKLGYDWYAGL